MTSKPTTSATDNPSRNLSMSEGKIVNKYTLIPVGVLVAGVILTIAVMQWLYADKTRLTVLEGEVKSLKARQLANNITTQQHNETLNRIDKTVAVIAAKLHVQIPEGVNDIRID